MDTPRQQFDKYAARLGIVGPDREKLWNEKYVQQQTESERW